MAVWRAPRVRPTSLAQAAGTGIRPTAAVFLKRHHLPRHPVVVVTPGITTISAARSPLARSPRLVPITNGGTRLRAVVFPLVVCKALRARPTSHAPAVGTGIRPTAAVSLRPHHRLQHPVVVPTLGTTTINAARSRLPQSPHPAPAGNGGMQPRVAVYPTVV
ncbi:hypothetical protein FRB98_005313 [Tulasnella sp. 332]|nr:hypothetical protein FRB98_005313 [Tulasnella sp. 332]